MLPVRARTLLAGGALAAAAGVLSVHGAALGAAVPSAALVGVGAGAALGLVADRTAAARAGAFALGLGAAWVGYLVRAGVLPDIPVGRGLSVVLVVSLVTALATATAGRLPLWAGLLGAATMAGAYEATYTASATTVVADAPVAAAAGLLAAAVGFVVAGLVPQDVAAPVHRPTTTTTTTTAPAAPAAVRPVVLDESGFPVPAPRDHVDATVTSETDR